MRKSAFGGNSYQYGFSPTYAQANGKGYITQDELLGQTIQANELPMDAETAAIAAGSGSTQPGEKPIWGFLDSTADALARIFAPAPVTNVTNTTPGQTPAPDHTKTILIVGGSVVGVAILAYALKSKKPSRKR